MSVDTNVSKYQNSLDLNSTEIDTIGEILNISMGAAATAISVMLSRQVSITTPTVNVVQNTQFEYNNLEPAMGIEIEYVEGLHGSNIMIMSVKDVKEIVNLLLDGSGEELAGDAQELDEIHVSALGEIMNQMMGASSTALASFLNRSINISPPEPFKIESISEKFSSTGLGENIVTVGFRLIIENLLDSEFVTVLPVPFTKELVESAMGMGEDVLDDQAEMTASNSAVTGHTQVPTPIYEADYKSSPKGETKSSRTSASAAAQKPAQPVPPPPPAPRPAQVQMPMAAPHNPYAAMERTQVNRNVVVQPLQFASLDNDPGYIEPVDQVNLGLVMGVDMNVTVEIGRTKKQVKEILALRQGSIVELDKQAGDPVDIIVNGKLIARGDVVVIDENFGVRITEIVSNTTQK